VELTLEISKEKLGVSAFCPELDLYTSGKTAEEARRKLARLVSEYYQFLQDHRAELDAPLLQHLELYEQYLLPRLGASLLEASLAEPRSRALLGKLLSLFVGESPWTRDTSGNLVKSSPR